MRPGSASSRRYNARLQGYDGLFSRTPSRSQRTFFRRLCPRCIRAPRLSRNPPPKNQGNPPRPRPLYCRNSPTRTPMPSGGEFFHGQSTRMNRSLRERRIRARTRPLFALSRGMKSVSTLDSVSYMPMPVRADYPMPLLAESSFSSASRSAR